MYTAVIVVHIIVCVFLVLSVLLQKGKGAEIGAVFGSSEALFGSTGPITFLNKLTTIVAVVFMITSLTLTYLSAHRSSESVMEGVSVPQTSVPPAAKTQPQTAPPPVIPGEASKKAPVAGPPTSQAPDAVKGKAGQPSKGEAPKSDTQPVKH